MQNRHTHTLYDTHTFCASRYVIALEISMLSIDVTVYRMRFVLLPRLTVKKSIKPLEERLPLCNDL